MPVALLIGLLALAPAAPPPGRVALGQFGRWAAFRDPAPRRCYAVATPVGGSGGTAFVTVASWPGAGVRSQFAVRLARPAVLIAARLGGAAMPLLVRGHDAWAPDVRGDRRLAALLRGGGVLALAGRQADGHRFRDLYPLAGAAAAIDAMRLGCLGT